MNTFTLQGVWMQVKEIAELIEIIERSAIEEFELERSGVRIRVRKASPNAAPVKAIINSPSETPEEAPAGAAPALAQVPSSEETTRHIFKAPIVGTHYLAPKPDAEPFVKVGDRVTKGAVLCIIEAMKIFNQIESDVDGVITRILVENGQPVEYGEPLFEIQLDS